MIYFAIASTVSTHIQWYMGEVFKGSVLFVLISGSISDTSIGTNIRQWWEYDPLVASDWLLVLSSALSILGSTWIMIRILILNHKRVIQTGTLEFFLILEQVGKRVLIIM
jgi:hypothetical protein